MQVFGSSKIFKRGLSVNSSFDISYSSCQQSITLWKCEVIAMRSSVRRLTFKPGGGTPHMKGVVMLVENFELNS